VTEVPDGVPTKARAGQQSILLVRQGTTIHALHDLCAHAGGPLSGGRIVDGCIECPWHQSRYELTTGRRKAGPTTFDQPRYEIRPAEDGGWEVRRMDPSTGADT
jgi:nitrite reductase/ring-hydroxylating ferredoxin subunit